MHDGWLQLAALLANLAGAGWLALSLEAHWEQIRGSEPLGGKRAALLRFIGSLGLMAALALCLYADHPSMAALVWVMTLAVAAATVAFTLAWRPAALRPLLAWMPMRGGRLGE